MGRRSGPINPNLPQAVMQRIRDSLVSGKIPVSEWLRFLPFLMLVCFASSIGMFGLTDAARAAQAIAGGHAQKASKSAAREAADQVSVANQPSDASSKKEAPAKKERMLVEASEMRYDAEKDTVAAVGNARVYYTGRVLEADRVTYDRKGGRVYAEGHAKLTERDGSVMYGERIDLTEDFRDGFIDSLQVESADKTYFSAPHMERIEEDTAVFDKGTYTACQACKDNPERPRFWQVRAKRIVHKNDEHMIYYEDAALEFLGVPIAKVPFMSSPDPTVKRKSGILSPHYLYKNALGYGFGLPIFWALAPNYDLTLTPTVFTNQGFFGSAEWRHRLENGYYSIRANGIIESNPSAFSPSPWSSGNHKDRGSFESTGQFSIADHWKVGWEFLLLSDKWFLWDYQVPSQTLSSNYISESTSTIYLNGQGDRGYFDLRAYYFQGLSSHDFQPQQPWVKPVWDYNKTFDVDPAKSNGIGGQVELDFNLTSLSAASASFQAVGPRQLDHAYNLYDICQNYKPGSTNGDCLLRGIGGNYTRATTDVSWKRKFIDPLGEVWTPFAFARFNGEWIDLNTTNSYSFWNGSSGSVYSNASQLAFLGERAAAFYGQFTPGAGAEYRYPLFTRTGVGTLTFEPIGQIIVRPNSQIGYNSQFNLDAQSLVFDTSNLFEWNKYSGYDRFENGIRANYGAQLSANFDNGGYANLTFGQSYQVAGQNSYATPDAANVGLSSGLDTRRSDYVGSFSIAPSSALSLTTQGRFDVNSFEPRRIDVITSYNLGAWTGNIQYANYQQQPVIGYDVRREGLALSSRYKISENYFTEGHITFDMSRHYYPANITGYTYPGLFYPASYGVTAGYQDDCTLVSVMYNSYEQDTGSGTVNRNQVFLVSFQLRTLGDAKFSRSFANYNNIDGVRY
ncbi:LPS-assembly protein LptD [Beijerinckia mobilis]|uniref:LPS-assembly protein LptD n=1 Tax=Beijerinckia mobilis TaxID=231434 RepID=UPI00055095AB|nr:LPS-assembly protein LptD [Beijerinckia mobilis]